MMRRVLRFVSLLVLVDWAKNPSSRTSVNAQTTRRTSSTTRFTLQTRRPTRNMSGVATTTGQLIHCYECGFGTRLCVPPIVKSVKDMRLVPTYDQWCLVSVDDDQHDEDETRFFSLQTIIHPARDSLMVRRAALYGECREVGCTIDRFSIETCCCNYDRCNGAVPSINSISPLIVFLFSVFVFN